MWVGQHYTPQDQGRALQNFLLGARPKGRELECGVLGEGAANPSPLARGMESAVSSPAGFGAEPHRPKVITARRYA